MCLSTSRQCLKFAGLGQGDKPPFSAQLPVRKGKREEKQKKDDELREQREKLKSSNELNLFEAGLNLIPFELKG